KFPVVSTMGKWSKVPTDQYRQYMDLIRNIRGLRYSRSFSFKGDVDTFEPTDNSILPINAYFIQEQLSLSCLNRTLAYVATQSIAKDDKEYKLLLESLLQFSNTLKPEFGDFLINDNESTITNNNFAGSKVYQTIGPIAFDVMRLKIQLLIREELLETNERVAR